jgi:hypothetical protein
MTYAWGQYNDPDTLQGIEQYRRSGLTLWTPDDIRALGFAELKSVARSCSDLIDGTYNGNYPQSAKNVDSLTESIAKGETLVFMLCEDEKILATASLVHRSNSMQGKLDFAELSKAAKHMERAKDIQVRYLSKYRLIWAAENLPQTDFLYGSPRAAREGRDGTQGGKQAQGVWWGGRKHGMPLPLVVTNVGWNFRIGGIEPLTGFAAPLNTDSWTDAVPEVTVFTPSHDIAARLSTLIREGTNDTVKPDVRVLVDGLSEEPFFREARRPMPDIVSKYYVTEGAQHLPLRSSDSINAQLSDTISQKVIIESDVATTERGAHIMRWLLAAGWTFTGWQPSEVIFGGICPMFARVNSDLVHELIEPMHYPQYFDDSGLSRTKRILDGMYSTMRSNALNF